MIAYVLLLLWDSVDTFLKEASEYLEQESSTSSEWSNKGIFSQDWWGRLASVSAQDCLR